MRIRDMERRQQVEERKRHLFEVEREKREAILKKNQVYLYLTAFMQKTYIYMCLRLHLIIILLFFRNARLG